MNFDFESTKEQLEEIKIWLKSEYASISTGRATLTVLDSITIESYGSRTAIAYVATMSIEDPRTLRISPWDKSQTKEIEKAIQDADLGLSVTSDDQGIRVHFPQLTTETRTKLVKILKEKLEEARVRVRAVREATIKSIEAEEKEGGMGEDDKRRIKDELQKMITDSNNSLESLFEKKETDTMTV